MARVGNFSRDIQLLMDRRLSPEAQKKMIAKAAGDILKDAQHKNAVALGKVPPHDHWVDGREGAPFESINLPSGNITIQFQLGGEVAAEALRLLRENSPVRGGDYKKSHRLFADGSEISDPSEAIGAKKFVIISVVPYARKIERGLSKQAPDGVYEVTAALLRQRFGNLAQIRFTYQSVVEGAAIEYVRVTGGTKAENRARSKALRYPAISIFMR